jgi:hypothetical protein
MQGRKEVSAGPSWWQYGGFSGFAFYDLRTFVYLYICTMGLELAIGSPVPIFPFQRFCCCSRDLGHLRIMIKRNDCYEGRASVESLYAAYSSRLKPGIHGSTPQGIRDRPNGGWGRGSCAWTSH